jgi:hypothetical protein
MGFVIQASLPKLSTQGDASKTPKAQILGFLMRPQHSEPWLTDEDDYGCGPTSSTQHIPSFCRGLGGSNDSTLGNVEYLGFSYFIFDWH